jgi:hypothetical protein
MNWRPLKEAESARLKLLNEAGLKSVVLFVTATGLSKSILDATEPMRHFFVGENYHDYTLQSKGESAKVQKRAVIVNASHNFETNVSLYRPLTKDGDPRYWIYGLKAHGADGDAFAIFFIDGTLHTLNLTRTPIDHDDDESPIIKLLWPLLSAVNSVSEELIGRLRELSARGPLRAVCSGDTAIGRSIEQALDIEINSSPNPDYKGIELKSARNSPTRSTLFACVPDWSLSACKSSLEILERFGYQRGNDFKLYCTLSTQRTNSQGLRLRMDEAMRWLKEVRISNPEEQVAIWRLEQLEEKLKQKHPQTFWIKAISERRSDGEWFHLQSVIHTKNPNTPQLERLLGDGTVTVDHLIKRTAAGGAQEKGPLFKIPKGRIGELFYGEPKRYRLA